MASDDLPTCKPVIMDARMAAQVASDLPGARSCNCFGPSSDVFKVGERIFAIIATSKIPATINLKCDPCHALELRSAYPAVTAGYHQNKTHWNTIRLDGTVPTDELIEMISESHRLVLVGMPRSMRDRIP